MDQKIGALLQTKAAVPWCIPCGDTLLSCTNKLLKYDDLAELIKQEKGKYRLALMEITALNDKSSEKLLQQIRKDVTAAEPYGGMILYNACLKANHSLFKQKWQILLKKNYQ